MSGRIVAWFVCAQPQAGEVRLVVYDLAGREVRVLANGRLEADDYRARWDGRNESGQRVSGGMYVVRLEAEGRALVRRLVLLP
jgi:flagellar hook assembly protein FlgD